MTDSLGLYREAGLEPAKIETVARAAPAPSGAPALSVASAPSVTSTVEPATPPEGASDRREGRVAAGARVPHAVIIIENMTVPPDRRVWQQALALREEGWRVTVISPQMGSYRASRETIDGIDIRRHPLPLEARHIMSYSLEYCAALGFEAFDLLTLGLDDIDVVQICNPPDFLFLPALIAKKFGRAKIIFDHHDLTPELLADKVKGGLSQHILLPFARWAQAQTFNTADHVISTNSAFRKIAIEQGRKTEATTSVVYSAPDLNKIRDMPADPALKKGADCLLLWVGIIGSQDGIDLLLDAMAHLKTTPTEQTAHLLIVGDGPERQAMEKRMRVLALSDDVTFAGFLTGDDLAQTFVTADIGVGSDPKNPFNDRLAMNKTMEYMAYGLPIAMFDLTESRVIAGDAALYAQDNDAKELADAIGRLIQSPELRRMRGALGRARLGAHFGWSRQKETYLDVYRRLHPMR